MNTLYEIMLAEEKAFDISCALEAYMNAVEFFAECKSRGDRARLVSNGLDAAFLLAKQAGSKTAILVIQPDDALRQHLVKAVRGK